MRAGRSATWADAVAQRSNNDGDEGSEVSSAAIKALCMIASRARQNKASCSPGDGPHGRPLDRGKGGQIAARREIFSTPGSYCANSRRGVRETDGYRPAAPSNGHIVERIP